MIAMILPVFTLTLQPAKPLHFSIDELRTFLTSGSADYTRRHKDSTLKIIHRYPFIQCKQIKNRLLAIGICQGADFLQALADDKQELLMGENTCSIIERDPEIRNETAGISDTSLRYEFLTPWLALNQQNAKKFYELKGKQERDAFMQKILTGSISTFAKSIDYDLPGQLMCRSKVRFRRERIHDENVMVFLGTFETNLMIPDYLGIGQSISQGFGTIRRMIQEHYEEEDSV
jgi:hypothetical protein